ncbi:DUF6973 domain-containing protein [Echinicola strongylocentroti]|uniref:DUF6973 domain-containing protein n=1 Tax=Echinicola strongylocentroti TaxID=1795355 RepID=UPI0013A7057A|nr:hypothetical protein [Echinicola strongylocentroti]
MDYKGLKVNHKGRAIEALNYTLEDYQKLYLSKVSSTVGRVNATLETVSYPSLEELVIAEQKALENYPDLYNMNDKDIERIREDFPELTDEQLAENIELIEEYYEKNLQYDIFLEILSISAGTESSLVSRVNYYGGAACGEEFWFLYSRPTAATAVMKAKEQSEKFEYDIYGGNFGQTKSDAFRHAAWNALIAKYYADSKKDILKGLTLAQEFTSIHELCNEKDGIPIMIKRWIFIIIFLVGSIFEVWLKSKRKRGNFGLPKSGWNVQMIM